MGALRELALFAGGGGGLLGSILAGFDTRCAIEKDPACIDLLLRRQKEGMLQRFPIWDDIETFCGTPWHGEIDIVTGGFPCQDISSAGQGVGITGSRSSLVFEMFRVISEIRPQFVLAENSPNLRTKGLDIIIEGFIRLGYVGCVGVLGARDLGANHRRKRMWIVATDANWGRKRVGPLDAKVAWSQKARGVAFEFSDWWGVPRFARVDDGDTDRVDFEKAPAKMENEGMAESAQDRNSRIAMTGNAQVPAVVAAAGEILSGTIGEMTHGL